jgi:hypothetical protein
VGKLNEYLSQDSRLDLVVCCRREEYEQGIVRLSTLHGAVCLQPLTDEQIREYLEQLDRAELWQSIDASRELKELARMPLLLSVLAVAYQGNPICDQQELFDAYIERQLSQPLAKPVSKQKAAPSRRQTRYYLIYLARHLRETEF